MILSEEVQTQLDLLALQEGLVTGASVECRSCGTKTMGKATAPGRRKPRGMLHPVNACPACGAFELLRHKERMIHPYAFRPFGISRHQALRRIEDWRGWAPLTPNSVLAGLKDESNLHPLLVPFWIFDCTVTARYRGGAGREDDPSITTGTFKRRFSDLITPATKSLELSHFEGSFPLDTDQLEPYEESQVEGLRVERYCLDWHQAFEDAVRQMELPIREDVFSALGGRDRHIESLECHYEEIAFKLILLPVWVFAFHYGGHRFRLLLDAEDGRVEGILPRSRLKAVFAVALPIAAAALAAALAWVL